MPTYEYECRPAHPRLARSKPMTSKPVAACPKCKKPARRLISGGVGLLFKGSGFYSTDNRSSSRHNGDSAKDSDKSEPKSESKNGSTNESKSDAKSDAKSDSKGSSSSSEKGSASPSSSSPTSE